jgi:predicted secreted Zn-dependent protease
MGAWARVIFPIAILCVAAPAAAAKAAVDEVVEYFDVSGVTAAEILDDMRNKGPNISTGGAHALAATHADYRHESEMAYRRDGRCATIDLQVSLTLTYHIPRWADEANASGNVRNWWDSLIRRIWAHERGHARIAREGAEEIRKALLAVQPAANCDDLRDELRQTMRNVLAMEIEPRQRRFDLDNRVVVKVSAR